MKKKIVLVMIVKNEEKVLRTCLKSVENIVDEYVIVDTGSTDGTKEIIAEYGPVYEEPFVDFVTTKNRALEIALGKGDYVLFMDADETLISGSVMLLASAESGTPAVAGYIVEGEDTTQRYKRTRMWRNDGNWRFCGPGVHEYIYPVDGKYNVFDDDLVVVKHNHDHRAPESYRDRNDMYVRILNEALLKDPTDTRAAFYLARTLKDLGDNLEAVEVYKQYLVMDSGFRDEIWQSLYDIAECYKRVGEYELAMKAAEEAIAFDNRRAEAHVLVGLMHQAIGNHEEAAKHFETAAGTPIPDDVILFQNPRAHDTIPLDYAIMSYYDMKQYGLALSASEELLALKPFDTRLQSNTEVIRRMAHKRIFFYLGHTPEPFHADMISRQGVGGVETTYIELPKALAKRGHDVVVFARTEEEHRSGGVQFVPYEKIMEYMAGGADAIISSRSADVFDLPGMEDMKKITWLQDAAPFVGQDRYGGDMFVVSSPWHHCYVSEMMAGKGVRKPIKIIPLGINLSDFFYLMRPAQKKRNQVIYSSSPDRGLEYLGEMWPEIVKAVPDIHLVVTYGSAHLRTWSPDPEWQTYVNNLDERTLGMFKGHNNVTFTGRLKKSELYKVMGESDLMLYPCAFSETFCLTGLEAQASRTPVITSFLGALPTTLDLVNNTLIVGSPSSASYQNAFISEVKRLLVDDREDLERRQAGVVSYVDETECDWGDIAEEWETLLYNL